MTRVTRVSFVVRVVEDACGQVTGVIERVATGAKETFSGMETIGRVIGQMLGRTDAPPPGPTQGDQP
jgi:hypothetical protein